MLSCQETTNVGVAGVGAEHPVEAPAHPMQWETAECTKAATVFGTESPIGDRQPVGDRSMGREVSGLTGRASPTESLLRRDGDY